MEFDRVVVVALATHPATVNVCCRAGNPADRRRGVPAFLRAGDDGSVAEHDVEFNEDVHIQRGDKILMNFPAACHDPEHFEDPDTFIIDRARNRHVALVQAFTDALVRTWLGSR